MEKKPSHQNLRKELDRIQTQWDKLKRETVDRYNRLQTAMVKTPLLHLEFSFTFHFIMCFHLHFILECILHFIEELYFHLNVG